MTKPWVSLVGGAAVIATVLMPATASAQHQQHRRHHGNGAAIGAMVGLGLLAGAAIASQPRRVYRERAYSDYDEPRYGRETYVRRVYREPVRVYRDSFYERPRYGRREVCETVPVRRRDGTHWVRQCE